MRHSKVVKAEITSAESFCSTSQFLAHDGSPNTFVNAKVSTQRKTILFLHKLTFLLCRSVSFLGFACGTWPSTGRGVVRALHIHSMKMKTTKISS